MPNFIPQVSTYLCDDRSKSTGFGSKRRSPDPAKKARFRLRKTLNIFTSLKKTNNPDSSLTQEPNSGGPDGRVGVGQPLLDALQGGPGLQPTKPKHLDPLRCPGQRLSLHHGAAYKVRNISNLSMIFFRVYQQ